MCFFSPESLNLIEESLNVTRETKQVPLPQPCQPAIGLAKQKVTCQETVPITAEVKSQELIPQTTEEIQKTPPSGESETEGEIPYYSRLKCVEIQIIGSETFCTCYCL